MTALEMFMQLPHLDNNRNKDPEGYYDPVLKKTDGSFYLSYECYGFDSIYWSEETLLKKLLVKLTNGVN